jgi:mutator protein MutT
MDPRVRPTALLVEDGKILIVEQRVSECLARQWCLPGGTVQRGETLKQCLLREVKEETGLEVEIERLLYVCDRIEPDVHVLHITFAVRRVGGELRVGEEPEATAYPIHSLRMVALEDLCDYGFDSTFRNLAEAGFPDGGTYRGRVSSIGL